MADEAEATGWMRHWSRTPARWAREPPELLTCQRHAPPPLTRRFGHTRRHPGKRGFRVGSLGRISSPGAAFCATRGQLIKKWVRNKEGTGLAVCSQPSVECRSLVPARNEPPRLGRGGFFKSGSIVPVPVARLRTRGTRRRSRLRVGQGQAALAIGCAFFSSAALAVSNSGAIAFHRSALPTPPRSV